MINLENYKPLIDTTTLSDDEIELWYGSKFAVRVLRMIEGCEIKYDFEKYPDSIFYLKDDIYILKLVLPDNIFSMDNNFYIDYDNIWSKLQLEFGFDYYKLIELTTKILKQHFKCGIERSNLIRPSLPGYWNNK